MGRRLKGELQTITAKDIGVLDMARGQVNVIRNRNHGENNAKRHKCSICKQEYTIYDPKNPNKSKDGKFFRFSDEWNESEILAHKISHIKLSKSRRLVAKFVTLTQDEREVILSFINTMYS